MIIQTGLDFDSIYNSIDIYHKILCILIVEVLFYIYYKILHSKFNKVRKPINISQNERKALIKQIRKYFEENNVDKEKFLHGWFNKSENKAVDSTDQIQMENLIEFFTWSLFSKSVDSLNTSQIREVKQLIVDEILTDDIKVNLSDGKNENIKPLRINLDNLQATYRNFFLFNDKFIISSNIYNINFIRL